MEFGIKMVRFSLIFNFVVTCCLSHPIEPNGTSMSALLTNMSQAIESIIEVSENFLDMVKRFETFEQSTQIDIDRLEIITEAATIVTQNIMVVSGYGQEGYINKTEIWSHPPKLQCPLQDFPLYLEGAVGFITAQDPVLCGGRGDLISNQCYVFNKGWMPWKNMTSVRAFASSIRISSHKTLIIGGFDENENALKTTELMSASGAEEANDFPVKVYRHCTLKINSTHGLIIGGYQDGSNSAATWYVELVTLKFTPGPTMNMERNSHGCATFHLGNKTYGIASGGWNGPDYLDTTELIDLDQTSPTWIEGPKLSRGLSGLTLMETSQGTFAMGGGDRDRNRLSEVLKLVCPEDQIEGCQWQEMEGQKLDNGRHFHVSISLSESYDICNHLTDYLETKEYT